MRAALERLGVPEHLGLAYDAWAPVSVSDGKVPDPQRSNWLAQLATLRISPDYFRAFQSWRASFKSPHDRVFELTLATRLLVGHGNSSAIDVGLTVHHTWGVPVVPGPAVKGLLAHYVGAVYGPDDPDRVPWEQPEDQAERSRYQGVTWQARRIRRGPGDVYRALFGSPEADEDPEYHSRGLPAGASAGLVVFHDALYVPGSAKDDRPFAIDVLTVHQKCYYDSSGRRCPNDYDNPNPVSFLTVRPGVRFLFALSGPPEWTAIAQRVLVESLGEWGVGAKTSSGYGRLLPADEVAATRSTPPQSSKAGETPKAGDLVEAVLLEERTKRGGWRARHEPSGLAGPVQNSADVPASARPGDRLRLIVASVGTREMAFRFPTQGDIQSHSSKHSERRWRR